MSQPSPKYAKVEALLDLISNLCILVASCALVVLIITFGWLVFGRYVLNATPTWVEQLALLLICYIAFLGAAAGVRENSHLGVSVFREMLPSRFDAIAQIATDLALAIFGAVMLIAGIELMKFGWDSKLAMLNIPESFRTLAITSCGALTLLFAGSRAVLRILKFGEFESSLSLKGN
jgi:TRAP-type C4-dicarboxylate transport system permease small subunit